MQVRRVGILIAVFALITAAFFVRRFSSPQDASTTKRSPIPSESSLNEGSASVEVDCRIAGTPDDSSFEVLVTLSSPRESLKRIASERQPARFDRLDPAHFSLKMTSERFQCAPSSLELDLSPGEHRRLVIFLNFQSSISGRITSTTGEGIKEVQLAVEEVLDWQHVPLQEGRYEIRVPASSMLIRTGVNVRAEGFVSERREVALPPRENLKGIDFVLQRGGSVFGIVVDGNGRPVENALVSVSSPNIGCSSRTKADGTYTLGPIPKGTYDASAQARDFLTASKRIEMGGGLPQLREDFTLHNGWTIQGRVLGPKDVPHPGASVYTRGTSVTSDKDGLFVLSGIRPEPAGKISCVTAEAENLGRVSQYDVEPGSTVVFRLGKSVLLRLKVTNVPASLKAKVECLVQPQAGDERKTAYVVEPSNETGIRLRPAIYEITAVISGIHVKKVAGVVVDGRDAQEVTIDLSGIDLQVIGRAQALDAELNELLSKSGNLSPEERKQRDQKIIQLTEQLLSLRRQVQK